MTDRIRKQPLLRVFALACLLAGPEVARAQSPTGTITGRVTDTFGAGVPGVAVTIESPALQRPQSSVTSPAGDYIFKFLPPGIYTAIFHLPGFADARHTRTVSAAEPVTIDVALQPATVQESVTVTADPGSFVNTVEGATNLKASVLGALPTTRDVLSAIALSPSAHPTGPSGNFTIAGAMSFDNLLMVNGVPVQENLRGEPLELFIEDAIQETTVTTSGISAEYGRFSGGVVNTVTKSGGNMLSGSFRTTFDNDNWRSVSPFGETKVDRTVPTYEVTVGGPVVVNRVWFFGAGRAFDTTVSRETGYTRVPYERSQRERRTEVKVTQAPAVGHRVAVNYVGITARSTNAAWPSSSQIMDLESLTNPENPQSLFGLHYTAAVSSRLYLEAQYSRRTLGFVKNGGLNTDLIAGTPLRDQQTGAWWWAPNFCGVCPDEERNNDSLVVKASYFISNQTGAHDIVAGYDGYNDKTRADNHQSASDYHVWATASTIQDGVVYPVIEPGFSTFIVNWPIRQTSQGTNLRTHALFINDRWTVGPTLTMNLGMRYDTNDGRDSSGALVSNTHALTPRLGLAWDPQGSGRTSVTLSLGRYVAALNNGLAGAASPAGNPAILAYFYGGPAINAGSGPLVPTDAALRQVFDWFNTRKPSPFFVDIPGVATKVGGQLRSPFADEVTIGVNRMLGSRGSVRVDVVNRTFGDFYSKRTDTSTGQVFDEYGQQFDLTLIENTDALTRRYRALNLQAGYRGTDVTVGAAYTLSRLWGNVDGETVESGPISSSLFAYPEYHDVRWAAPEGDLAADQRHRARVWATWALPFGRRWANVTLGAIQSLQSGTPYGAVGSVVVSPFVANPGYALPPDVETYYFTARDAFHTDASYRTDIAINLDRGIGNGRARLFAQLQLLNAFNRFQVANVAAIDTTVTTAVDDLSLPLFDPLTESPVEGVHWRKSTDFGKPSSRNAYTLPRTFTFSVGVKF